MKAIKQFLFLCFLAVLTACSEDAFVPQQEVISAGDDSVDLISMVVPDVEIDATTRSKLYEDGDELKFTWQENDAIGVVPMSGSPLHFPIHAENAGTNTALFDGGGWALKTNIKYAAFFPIKTNNQTTDIHNIAFDYTGQNESNYAKYDFLATGAIKPKDGAVKFTMQRLSAILKIKITMPAGSYGRYGTLSTHMTPFNIKGTLDLSGTEPVYNVTEKSKFIHTQLNADRTSTSEWTYEVFMMIPPTNLDDETLLFSITSDKGYAYNVYFQGKNYEAGKAYVIEEEAYDVSIMNANLISAAESQNSITFNKVLGEVNVNDATNQTLLKQVKTLKLEELNDSTVCNQIEFFPNLEKLNCKKNGISSLDISKNTKLTELKCDENKLTSLDVSNNTALTELTCNKNQLTALDVSKLLQLKYFECSDNQLTSLDVSNNTALALLYCGKNLLKTLDVTNNTELSSLACYTNQLTSLDVSKNTKLTYLVPQINQLSEIDVTKNTNLMYFYCDQNKLTSLDLSNNTKLRSLQCFSNQLTTLDVSNNPELTSLHCNNNQLTTLSVTNNMKLAALDISLNQFESFTIINHSNLKYLKASNMPTLKTLYCTGNALETLYVYNCLNLKILQCYNNNLTSLSDVTTCPSLISLGCYNNLMSELDIRNCTSLKLDNVACGNQWADIDKTEPQTLKLYITSSNTGSLYYTDSLNKNVRTISD